MLMLNPVLPSTMDTDKTVGLTVQPVTYTFVYKWEGRDVSERTRAEGRGQLMGAGRNPLVLFFGRCCGLWCPGLGQVPGQGSVALEMTQKRWRSRAVFPVQCGAGDAPPGWERPCECEVP